MAAVQTFAKSESRGWGLVSRVTGQVLTVCRPWKSLLNHWSKFCNIEEWSSLFFFGQSLTGQHG